MKKLSALILPVIIAACIATTGCATRYNKTGVITDAMVSDALGTGMDFMSIYWLIRDTKVILGGTASTFAILDAVNRVENIFGVTEVVNHITAHDTSRD